MAYKQYTIRLSLDTVKQNRACQMLDECGRAKGFLISEALCLYDDIMRRGMESSLNNGGHSNQRHDESEYIPVRQPNRASNNVPNISETKDTPARIPDDVMPTAPKEDIPVEEPNVAANMFADDADVMSDPFIETADTVKEDIEDRVDEQPVKSDPYADLLKAMTDRQSEAAEVDPLKAIDAIRQKSAGVGLLDFDDDDDEEDY